MAEVNERLRELVEARRKELGLTPTKLAEATGLTTQGLMPIRRGEVKRYQERLTGPLCAALGWTADSVDRILAGGDPIIEGGLVDPSRRTTVTLPADEAAALRQLIAIQALQLVELTERVEDLDAELRTLRLAVGRGVADSA